MNVPNKRWGSHPIPLKQWSLPALKAKQILDAIPQHASQLKILDFGCGEGKILKTIHLAKPGHDLYGVDIQQLLHPNDFKFFQLHEHATDKNLFPQNYFDIIICQDVLEHVKDIHLALQLIHHWLKRDGIFISYIPMEGNLFSFYSFYQMLFGKDLYIKTKDHRHSFSRKKIRNLIENHFNILSTSYSYHLLGGFCDATFFALHMFPPLKKWWWSSNSYYHSPHQKGLLNRILGLINNFCFIESTILKKMALFSHGWHIIAKKTN